MDYYQGVVVEYLRARRSTFVNTEFCLQLNEGAALGGQHWFCDAVAVDFNGGLQIYLCEVSYAKNLQALLRRLVAWHHHWKGVLTALERDTHISGIQTGEVPVRPWLFVPRCSLEGNISITERMKRFIGEPAWGETRVKALEDVTPWLYCGWDRKEVASPQCEENCVEPAL